MLDAAIFNFGAMEEESEELVLPAMVLPAMVQPLAESFIKMYSEREYIGFQTDICTLGYYIYTEEYGDPDMAAEWIHILMQLNVITETKVLLEWAFTCSKPRPGEFGGGACLITKQKIHWRESAEDWAESLLKEINHAA